MPLAYSCYIEDFPYSFSFSLQSVLFFDVPDKLNCLQSSFARYMSSHGFDTWILEVRGAGLSTGGVRSAEVKKPVQGAYSIDQTPDLTSNTFSEIEVSLARDRETKMVTKSDKSLLVTKLTEAIIDSSEKLAGWLNEGQSRITYAILLSDIRTGTRCSSFFNIHLLRKTFQVHQRQGKILLLLNKSGI